MSDTMTTTQFTTSDLVICRSADGWSIHRPGSTDEDIASGDAPYILSGPGRSPSAEDLNRALATL